MAQTGRESERSRGPRELNVVLALLARDDFTSPIRKIYSMTNTFNIRSIRPLYTINLAYHINRIPTKGPVRED